MYCIKCGVELADSEDKCPLCGTVVYHPDIPRPDADPLFPNNSPVAHYKVTQAGGIFIMTSLFLIGILMPLICDLSINGSVTWSGIVMGAVAAAYVCFVLPFWFRAPNPVIFVPTGFAACGAFLLYLDLYFDGGWFMTFALPTTGVACLICTAVVALCRYVRRGYLYIIGGAVILSGAATLLTEGLLNYTFGLNSKLVWSIYPCTAASVIGIFLLITAISPKLRSILQKKFFV